MLAGDLDGADAATIVAAHHAALRGGGGVLKDAPGSAVTRVRVPAGELCVKQYRVRGWFDRAKALLRPSPAWRAWRASEVLGERGIETARPLGLLEHRGDLHLITSFVDLPPLGELLFEMHVHQRRVAAKRALLEALGAWLCGLHGAGVDHDDCSTKNLLVRECAQAWEFVLLDLDGVRFAGAPRRRRRVINLSQLIDPPTGLTLTDRLRVIRAYARAANFDVRALVREVSAAVRARSTRRVRTRARGRRRNERRRSAEARRQGNPSA